MNAPQSRIAQPIVGEPLLKYFLDRNGVTTRRMANVSGKGHFEIASSILGPDAKDMYAQMAKLGYARVQETDKQIHVEAKSLTNHQKRYLKDRSLETKREVVMNSQQFVESKDPRANQVVAVLLA